MADEPRIFSEARPVVVVTSTSSSNVASYFWYTRIETKQNFDRPTETHPIYPLVGQVAAEWARLEHVLDHIIAHLADIPAPIAACITAQLMGAWPRYNSIIALLTQRSIKEPEFKDYLNRVRSLAGRSQDISEKRNRIVHDPWFHEQTLDKLAQFKSMPKADPKYGLKEVDLEEINQTLSSIRKLSGEALKLWADMCPEGERSKG